MKKLIISTLLLITVVAFGQQPLPSDPSVRVGKLDNGLTYYIKVNKQPKERADFHIAQNVGAILENDDQNGLAHFLEHMAFNGTKNMPGKMIINYFESIGVRFGVNINAYTALDQTVYRLSDVPTYRESIVDSALLVMHDWACAIELKEEEIDSERKVIVEEWRQTSGAGWRMWMKANEQMYPGSQYAKRSVIGDTAIIKNFSYQTLRDYYHKWYRPDQQAIVVVGDVDADKVENRIKELFNNIPTAENKGERPIYDVENNAKPIVSVVKDPEATYTKLRIIYKHEPIPNELKSTDIGLTISIVNEILENAINERLEDNTQDPNCTYVAAGAVYMDLLKSKDAFSMIVIPKEGQEIAAYNALIYELEKFKRYGLTAGEIERAKANVLVAAETAAKESENVQNINLAELYVDNYLNGTPIPSFQWKYDVMQQILPELAPQMINSIVQQYVGNNNIIICFESSTKEGIVLPTEEEAVNTLLNASNLEIEAPAAESASAPLMETTPKAGKIKKIEQLADVNAVKWTLSNGVKVIIKQTAFKNDEILMSAYGDGGLSLINNVNDLYSATLASTIVSSNGVANHTMQELMKMLSGKNASVYPYISSYSQGVEGSSSVRDFETMMQLSYLYFTAPRKNEVAYNSIMERIKASLANSTNDPASIFNDSVTVISANYHPRAITFNPTTILNVNEETAVNVYKQRFANASNFTFVLVGNIDPTDAKTKELILSYLGSLPKGKKEGWKDNKVDSPKGDVKKNFAQTMEIDKTTTYINYTASMPYTLDNIETARVISNILSNRYLEEVREKEGATYRVRVNCSMQKYPKEELKLVIKYDTDPSRKEQIVALIDREIQKIINEGPLTEDLQKSIEIRVKSYQEGLEENNWWLRSIIALEKDGINISKDYLATIQGVNSEKIKTMLKNLLEQNNRLEIVMDPK